ncbi:MAG TPA: branched-chain amino acid ABC transporter permease, partial [Burkholderiaceae bacterium]
GYPVHRYKVAAFVLSAALAGLAGGLFAMSHQFVTLDALHWTTSGQAVVMVVLGGIGTLWGPILGAVILIPLSEFTRSYIGGSGSGVDLMLYGGLVMAVALLKPEGLIRLFAKKTRKPGPAR